MLKTYYDCASPSACLCVYVPACTELHELHRISLLWCMTCSCGGGGGGGGGLEVTETHRPKQWSVRGTTRDCEGPRMRPDRLELFCRSLTKGDPFSVPHLEMVVALVVVVVVVVGFGSRGSGGGDSFKNVCSGHFAPHVSEEKTFPG